MAGAGPADGDSKRLDLKAITAELEAKREAVVKMETEQVLPTEAKIVQLSKAQGRPAVGRAMATAAVPGDLLFGGLLS